MSPTKRLITRRGGVIALTNATYLTSALGLVSSPILARSLGPVGRGEVAGASAYAFLTAALLGLGFPSAIAYFSGTRRLPSDILLGMCLRYSACCFPLAMVASLLVLKGPLGGFTAPGRLAALLLILAAPVYVLQLSVQSVLIGNGALAALTKLQLFTAITLTSGVVILAISHDLTTTSYAILYGSAIVAVALATVASVAKKPRFRSNLKPVLVFGLKAAPAGLANFASIRLDQILLAPLLGARPLGIYAVAVSVASVPNALGSAIAVASYKTVAASAVQSDEAALSEAARSIRVCFIGTGLLAVVVGAPAALAVPFLFGNDFRGAVLPLVILLPGSVALAASMTAHSTLIAIGRPLAASLGELVGLTVTAVGLAVFVRRFGVVGAAVVSTTAYVFTMVVFLSILYRRGARHLLPRSRDIKIQMEWLRSRARAIAQRI